MLVDALANAEIHKYEPLIQAPGNLILGLQYFLFYLLDKLKIFIAIE